MVLARWQATIADDEGNVLPGATVTVRAESSGAPLASLFSDRDGQAGIGNPFNAGSDGFAAFHVASGVYRIDVISGLFTQTFRYVGISLSSEQPTPGLGIHYSFSSETADADPGDGFIRLNNATPLSVTEIYVSKTDGNGVDQSAFLETLDDPNVSGDRGLLILHSPDQSAVFVGRVTGALTDNTTYFTIDVTPLSASAAATFIAGEAFSFIFLPRGADGLIAGPVSSVAGQIVIFDDATGDVIGGGVNSASPPVAVTLANILNCTELAQATISAEGVVELASTAEIRASGGGSAKVLEAQDLNSAVAAVMLTDAATIAVDWSTFLYADVTLTANRVLGNPSNEVPGQFRVIRVRGDATSPPIQRTLTFGNQFGGSLPTLDDIDDTKEYILTIFCVAFNHFILTAVDGSTP